MMQEAGVQFQAESYQRFKKWYLIPPCLSFSIIRYGSRVKWCRSYWKRSLRVAFDYDYQIYLLLLMSTKRYLFLKNYLFSSYTCFQVLALFRELLRNFPVWHLVNIVVTVLMGWLFALILWIVWNATVLTFDCV